MIGEDFARLNMACRLWVVEHHYLPRGGVGHKHITVGSDRQPSRFSEAGGKNGNFKSGRNLGLKVRRRSYEYRLVVDAKKAGYNPRSPAANV